MKREESNNIEESITCTTSRERRTDGSSHPADDRNEGQQLDHCLHRTRRTVRSWSPGGSRLEPAHDYPRNDNVSLSLSLFFYVCTSLSYGHYLAARSKCASKQTALSWSEPKNSVMGTCSTVYPKDVDSSQRLPFGLNLISYCGHFDPCLRWP